MKRFVFALLTLFAVALPLTAQAQPKIAGDDAVFSWRQLYMRNTSAAAIAREPNWAKPTGSTSGFADSTVYRRTGTLTAYDTTVAIPVDRLAWPPHTRYKAGTTAVTDTNATLPWIALRVSQDSVSYSWTGGVSHDSIHVGAQFSLDGINWNAIAGTPTKNPSAAFFTSGEDGVAPLGVKAAEKASPASDIVDVTFDCIPQVYTIQPDGPYIIHRTMCMVGGYIRFILSSDGTGQFKAELGSWSE